MRKLLLLLISLVLIFGFGGCKKSPTEPTEPKIPPVKYDETNNTVAIPDATIITNGVSYKEKAPMLEDGLAVVKLVVESDTLLYFYTPLQGDIDSLTPISSLEALQKAYFSRLEDMRGEQTPVMITINPLSSGDIEVTNEAFRCAAVEGGSSQPVILPARTLFDLNLISIFQNQWGEFLTFNKKAVDTLEFHSSDSLLLYGSVARLGIFGPAIASVLMSENYDFISKVQEAFEANPSLYTRICLADELDIIFFAVKLVLGSSGTDFFSSKLTQSVVSILADVTHQGLESVITAKSVPEATSSIFNTVLKDIPQAMLNSMTSTRNSSASTSSSTRSISVAIVLKALVTVVSGSELVVGGYQSLTAAPFGTWVASNNSPGTPSEPSGPNTGDVGTSYSFSTSTTDPDGDSIAYQFDWGDGNISSWSSYVSSGSPVSMSHSWSSTGIYSVKAKVKDINGAESGWSDGLSFTITLETGTVTDIDGNVYQTVKIGDQLWMAENLKVTHYRNGDAIPNVTDSTDWGNLTTGAYCNYYNDANNATTYGRLYNWYAVNDSRNIAPEGWHVPSDEEWKTLEMYLGMSQSDADDSGRRGTGVGGKMKEAGTEHWNSPNTGATNESGFSALPGGYRSYKGTYYYGRGYFAHFWSSTEYDSDGAWYRDLYYNDSGVWRGYINERDGVSVRCVRD